jgi:peptide/nickel transport system permease protein
MMRERFGLDLPIGERLMVYLARLGQGDLGFSYRHNQSAVGVILAQLPATLLLMIPALLIAAFIGIVMGVVAAGRHDTASDAGLRIVSLLGHTIPVFWLAQLMLLLFAVELGLLPVQGMTDARADYQGIRHVLDVAQHMVLPVLALVFVYLASIMRITRASVLEALDSPFILAARARGLTRRQVLVRHALPNSVLPIVTVIGSQFGFMLAGAVLVETVFAWPGLGRLLLSAMLNRDFAIITAMFLMISSAIIFANLVIDIAYSFLDPRVRYE